MAVHRPGASGEDREWELVELGHLLVTIDDFKSILQIIHTYTQEKVSISFIGGHIDEPEDLRSLTEAELAHVKIAAPGVRMELADTTALYTGPYDVGDRIKDWSRAHQRRVLRRRRTTRKRRTDIDGVRSILPFLLLIGTLLTFILTTSSTVTSLLEGKTSGIGAILAISYAASFIVLARYLLHRSQTRKVTSSCVIIPLSRDEYRKDKILHKRQMITWTIATLAVVATLIATQLKK